MAIASSPRHPRSSGKEPPNSKLIREHFFRGGFIHLPSQNPFPFHLDFVKTHRRWLSMIWYLGTCTFSPNQSCGIWPRAAVLQMQCLLEAEASMAHAATQQSPALLLPFLYYSLLVNHQVCFPSFCNNSSPTLQLPDFWSWPPSISDLYHQTSNQDSSCKSSRTSSDLPLTLNQQDITTKISWSGCQKEAKHPCYN